MVSWILTIWFLGSFLVFFLARALGGEVGYSQVLGIVGYCLIPLVVVGVVLPLVSRWHYIAMFFKVIYLFVINDILAYFLILFFVSFGVFVLFKLYRCTYPLDYLSILRKFEQRIKRKFNIDRIS